MAITNGRKDCRKYLHGVDHRDDRRNSARVLTARQSKANMEEPGARAFGGWPIQEYSTVRSETVACIGDEMCDSPPRFGALAAAWNPWCKSG